MTRAELRNQFRVENPEITDRVITDAELNSFMLSANKQICCETMCIVSNVTETFNSVVDTQYYDLESNITNFYSIDDNPGGGVYYNDLPLTKTTPAELNRNNRSWKSRSSGTPLKYWLRGKYLWFDRAPDASSIEIGVDCAYIPDDFDADGKEPFNELGHLQVFTDGIVKYLQWRCKQKIGKFDEAANAKNDLASYTAWMRKQVRGAKNMTSQIRPKQ